MPSTLRIRGASPNALTVNYGIRYDLFDLASPKVKNPDPGLAAANLDTSLIPIDKNNVGGRFGFAYRLTSKRQHGAPRRRRQLLCADSEHPDGHGIHAKRNPGADLHADSRICPPTRISSQRRRH